MYNKVNFNEGEGLTSADLDLAQELQRKQFVDSMAAYMATSGPHHPLGDYVQWNPAGFVYDSPARPLRHTGCFERKSSTTIDVYGGVWSSPKNNGVSFTAWADAPDTDSSLLKDTQGELALAKTETLTVTAASAGNFRRDLIQVEFYDEASISENRDFQDAATRALTTQSATKRTWRGARYSIKQGGENTESFVSNPSNQASPDAGKHVVGAILVSDSGISDDWDKHWDWRKPWGEWADIVSAMACYTDAEQTFYIEALNPGEGVIAPFKRGCTASNGGPYISTYRLRSISLAGLLTVDVTATDIPNIAGSSPLASRWAPFANFPINARPLAYNMYIVDPFFGDPPLWSNGTSNSLLKPADSGAGALRFSFGAAGDKFSAMQCSGWGGF